MSRVMGQFFTIEEAQVRVPHVDDEPDFIDLSATFIERGQDDFSFEAATSADEGLIMIDGCRPDCVVSDYNMHATNQLIYVIESFNGAPRGVLNCD